MSSDEIKSVHRVYRLDGEYAVFCPHCHSRIYIEGDDLSEILGEQYHHKSNAFTHCDGWFQVETSARYAGRMHDD